MSGQRQPAALVLTCEHASNAVPADYQSLFRHAADVLDSHRGWDIGAARLGTYLADRLHAPLFQGPYSRLLIDLNRSLGHPALFSEYTRKLDRSWRSRLVEIYWRPWRAQVETLIEETLAAGWAVVHVSVHSFTPVLNGQTRRAEIGLLYDPRCPGELAFARRWQHAMRARTPALTVRRNSPYQGRADGFATALRRRFPERYLGIELETNQDWIGLDDALCRRRFEDIGATLGLLVNCNKG